MVKQYETEQEDEVEFVGHYDRFFKNISDPEIKREVNEKEALILQRIDAEKKHQLKIKSEREKFALASDGMTHQELMQAVSGNAKNLPAPDKTEPVITVSTIARKLFEKTLAKDKPLVDFHGFQTIHDFITKNEYLTLSFMSIRSINLLSPITCIIEEQWIKGVKKNYDVYTKPLKVKPRSRFDAIKGLISKGIIYKINFDDKKGIFYFLNTENGKKIYDLVEDGILNRDDLEKINELFRKKLLHCLDPKLIEKFLQYRSAKFADLSRENHYSDQHYFPKEPANSTDREGHQSQTESVLQNSLPSVYPKESPKGTFLDHIQYLTFGKNPIGDFPEGDQLKFLESRLGSWKRNSIDLNRLIEAYTLNSVFIKTINLEEKERTGKIKKIGSFFPYMEKALLNDKLKAGPNSKKQPEKNTDILKFLPLFQIFNPAITDVSLKSNWNAIVNTFAEKLKSYCNDENKELILSSVSKINNEIKNGDLEVLLLNAGLTNDEVQKILKFLSEN
jgi:hypothetical protein